MPRSKTLILNVPVNYSWETFTVAVRNYIDALNILKNQYKQGMLTEQPRTCNTIKVLHGMLIQPYKDNQKEQLNNAPLVQSILSLMFLTIVHDVRKRKKARKGEKITPAQDDKSYKACLKHFISRMHKQQYRDYKTTSILRIHFLDGLFQVVKKAYEPKYPSLFQVQAKLQAKCLLPKAPSFACIAVAASIVVADVIDDYVWSWNANYQEWTLPGNIDLVRTYGNEEGLPAQSFTCPNTRQIISLNQVVKKKLCGENSSLAPCNARLFESEPKQQNLTVGASTTMTHLTDNDQKHTKCKPEFCVIL